jgi:hypothetical protein
MMPKVYRFESVDNFIAACRTEVKSRPAATNYHDHDWALGLTWQQAYTKAVEGDSGLARGMAESIEKINLGIGPVERMSDSPSVAGYRVVVPDFLGGNPRNMRRRVAAERQLPHVCLYICYYASAGVGAAELMKRGSAILALIEALQMRRIGADIYLVGENGGVQKTAADDVYTIIRIENRPLDLSTAAFALGHPAFGRQISLDWDIAHGVPPRGPWPHNYRQPGYLTRLAEIVEAPPGALIIPSTYLSDHIIFTNPERWVTEMLRQLSPAQ